MKITSDLIDLYRYIYNLPEIKHEEYLLTGHCQLPSEKHYFAVVAVYNMQGEFLLFRDFNKNIGWELPGGYINPTESIENAVNRIISNETGLSIDELNPVAIVKNVFISKECKIKHEGVAFMALSRGKIREYDVNIQANFTKKLPKRIAYQNEKILNFAIKKLQEQKYNPPIEEIMSIEKRKFLPIYLFHKYIVKPIVRFSSIKIKREIFKLIEGNPRSILDVSCGDSELINELYKKFKPNVCIGNDICWRTIMLMRNRQDGVIFTNHNVLELPYNIKFDLVIFKNTLHHISKNHQTELINKLRKIARQLIIVDVHDPQRASLLSKIWNRYYVYLLDDQGESFVTYDEFKKTIYDKVEGKNIDFGLINTIKGQYFFGSISDSNIQKA